LLIMRRRVLFPRRMTVAGYQYTASYHGCGHPSEEIPASQFFSSHLA